MNKIIGTKIDINKAIDNLRIRLRMFKNNELSKELKINKATFNGWVARGSGDFLSVIIAYCKEKNISTDEIFSENILDYREKKGYERGLVEGKKRGEPPHNLHPSPRSARQPAGESSRH
jgi:hypothetical protein